MCNFNWGNKPSISSNLIFFMIIWNENHTLSKIIVNLIFQNKIKRVSKEKKKQIKKLNKKKKYFSSSDSQQQPLIRASK